MPADFNNPTAPPTVSLANPTAPPTVSLANPTVPPTVSLANPTVPPTVSLANPTVPPTVSLANPTAPLTPEPVISSVLDAKLYAPNPAPPANTVPARVALFTISPAVFTVLFITPETPSPVPVPVPVPAVPSVPAPPVPPQLVHVPVVEQDGHVGQTGGTT